jgi:hypothetical protein
MSNLHTFLSVTKKRRFIVEFLSVRFRLVCSKYSPSTLRGEN